MNAEGSEDARAWLEMSKYDLDTAEAMRHSGRYLYVLFCCQQAVEKRLKGMIVAKTATMPPKIHDLLRLAEAAGIAGSPARLRLLAELNSYYVQTRYPEELGALAEQVTPALADHYLGRVKDYIGWLDQQMK